MGSAFKYIYKHRIFTLIHIESNNQKQHRTFTYAALSLLQVDSPAEAYIIYIHRQHTQLLSGRLIYKYIFYCVFVCTPRPDRDSLFWYRFVKRTKNCTKWTTIHTHLCRSTCLTYLRWCDDDGPSLDQHTRSKPHIKIVRTKPESLHAISCTKVLMRSLHV